MVRFKRRVGTKLSGSKAFKVLATMPLYTQFYKVEVESLPTANFRDEELTEVIEDIAEPVEIEETEPLHPTGISMAEFEARFNGIKFDDIYGVK